MLGLSVGNDHAVTDGDERGDERRIARQQSRNFHNALFIRRVVGSVEDASMPEHVVDEQHTARSQLLFDDRDRGRIACLVDVVEHQVERPFRMPKRLHGLPHGVLHDVVVAETAQVAARLLGKLLVPDYVMDHPTPILLYGAGEPGGRVAVSGTQLEYPAGAHQPGDQVVEVAGRRADDRKARLLGIRLHLLHDGIARRDEAVQILRQAGMKQRFGHESSPLSFYYSSGWLTLAMIVSSRACSSGPARCSESA